jgi:hypothetical protein
MNFFCRWLGHDPRGRQMDSDFKEYSRCNRCGCALERGEGGKWVEAKAEAPPSSSPAPPPPIPPAP